MASSNSTAQPCTQRQSETRAADQQAAIVLHKYCKIPAFPSKQYGYPCLPKEICFMFYRTIKKCCFVTLDGCHPVACFNLEITVILCLRCCSDMTINILKMISYLQMFIPLSEKSDEVISNSLISGTRNNLSFFSSHMLFISSTFDLVSKERVIL